MKTKFFTIFLLLVIFISTILPTTSIFAAATSGSCGPNLSWSVSGTTLSIIGSGIMTSTPWSSYKSTITRISLPSGLTEIANNAFSGFTKITSITLPNSLTVIGDSAFKGCTGLTTIAIPENVETIEFGAFANCTNVHTVNFNAIYLNDFALSMHPFQDVGKNVGGFTLNVGKNVTRIPKNFITLITANYSSTTLRAVNFLGNKVTSIGQSAFEGSHNLTFIKIPTSVTVIDMFAFQYTGLKDAIYMGTQAQWKSKVTVKLDNDELINVLRFHDSHSNTSTIISPATCTSTGQRKDVCSICGLITYSTIPKLNHTYSEWNVTKEATCAEAGSRNKTCINANCGNTVVESIPKLEHTFASSKHENDLTYHWHYCSTCKSQINKETHQYDNNCDTTCNVCNRVREITHSFSSIWSSDASQHWHQCGICTATKDSATHTFDNSCDVSCNICGYTRSASHNFNSVWSNDASQHWHQCSNCNEKADLSNHVYNNACDSDCNICGRKRTISHSFDSAWQSNSATHWHECSVCSVKKDEAAHIFTNSCDTTCDTCGFVRSITHSYNSVLSTDRYSHWYQCSICGQKKDISEHVFDNSCDMNCNICGYARTITHKFASEHTADNTSHWHKCNICDFKKDIGLHIFDNTCDSSCNICQYEREVSHKFQTKWFSNGTQHWHQCLICNKQTDNSPHTPSSPATEEKAQTCYICNYIIAPQLGHTHSFNKQLACDNEGHWYPCLGCNEKEGYQKHIFDNDCDSSCNLCNYTRPITHKYDPLWQKDSSNHWRECSICKQQVEIFEHTWDGGQVSENTILFTCTTCEQTMLEQIVTPTIPPTPTAKPEETPCATNTPDTSLAINDPNTPQSNSSLLWFLLIPAIVISVGIVLVIILKKRK